MPGRPGVGKHLWHGESACPHAPKSGSGGGETRVQRLTKCKHADPIPVCSQINNCDGDELWKYRAQDCRRTRRTVARIPQITSLDPGRPRDDREDIGGMQSAATHYLGREPFPRAYQQIKKMKVETECPSS